MSHLGSKQDERTPPSELLPHIAHQFSVYLKAGLEFDSVFQDIDPDLNINGLDDLLGLHFILSGQTLNPEQTERPIDGEGTNNIGVMDFLWLLPPRLRQLRTTTQRQTQEFNGEIRGRIDWQQTIKTRYRTGNVDAPHYACQLAEETIAIPENIVLWELLNKIQKAYTEATTIVPEDDGVSWFSPWQGDSRLAANLEAARSNIHLAELESEREEQVAVSDRMLRNVLESRSPLYAEAAELLQWYRDLQDHEIDPEEAKDLLRRRLFMPPTSDNWAEDETPAFFELYWIFNLLSGFGAPRRNLITKGTHCIASWTVDGSEYELYHDWSGGTKFDFSESYLDRERAHALAGEDRYLGRTTELLTIQEQETEAVFGHRRPSSKSRYPDFVLLRREGGTVTDIAIGEVKYTRRGQTAAKGLEELYRYMIFARDMSNSDPSYFTAGPNHFETPNVYGYLCVDKIAPKREPAGNVSVVQVGEAISPPF
ncbi:hypothetical protein [Natronorubrum halophilum]|uniref:hypothetical protein n=1 Tax=Natronorubrum halophilum TaxID=1702106 RepID=UPI0010C1793E|nr:hypothetical protein [Natronorubrum halophilum]